MAYITIANSIKITNSLNLMDLRLQGEIYDKPIYIFNRLEQQSLLAYKEFVMNPEKLIEIIHQDGNVEYGTYKKVDVIDNYKYVYEGKKPCYHQSLECERLKAEFKNFTIPDVIKQMGVKKIEEFRHWFSDYKELYLDDRSKFDYRLRMKFGISADINVNVEAVAYDNSGIREIENLDLTSLEQRINLALKQAGRFYYGCPKNTAILKQYSCRTFLWKNSSPLLDNNTGFSDEEVKNFLKNYEQDYKNPIKVLLQNYYRIKFNPELEMEGRLLDQLGFRSCRHCM